MATVAQTTLEELQAEYDLLSRLDDDPAGMFRSYDRFIELARRAFQEETNPRKKAAMRFSLENLVYAKNKEVLQARHKYREALKPSAAKKRMREYYDAEREAVLMMDIEMRGFIRSCEG